jgi:hypothetical protein
MLEQLLTQLREREVEMFLVRVFFRARQCLARAGYIEELGPDRMWHSISAGVQAARTQVNVKAKPHPQTTDADADDLEYADGEERIAVDTEAEVTPDEAEESSPRAPKGGYQDPDRAAR